MLVRMTPMGVYNIFVNNIRDLLSVQHSIDYVWSVIGYDLLTQDRFTVTKSLLKLAAPDARKGRLAIIPCPAFPRSGSVWN